MYFDITDALYIEDYKVKIHFADGSDGIADFSNYKNKVNIFKAFENIEYFKRKGILHAPSQGFKPSLPCRRRRRP